MRRVAYRRYGSRLLIFVALLGLAAGGWLWWRGDADRSHLAWALGTGPILLALFVKSSDRFAGATSGSTSWQHCRCRPPLSLERLSLAMLSP